jgi:hypothetical protein
MADVHAGGGMSLIASVILAAASPAPAVVAEAVFDCEMGKAFSARKAGGKHVVSEIGFGPKTGMNWKFTLIRTEKALMVEWPDSPVQINGKGPLIQTGPNSYSSFYIGKGPCLFTEGHCGGTVHFAAQTDGSLVIQIQPVALIKFEDGRREPFVAFIEGRCEKRKNQK